jgi:uncharacterized protein (TIGR03067 family)
MKMNISLVSVLALGFALASGCSTLPPSDLTALQGTWQGQEIRNGQVTTSWLTIDGREMEFRPSDRRDWFQSTFTLRENTDPKQLTFVVTASPVTGEIGRATTAIYELKPLSDTQWTLVLTRHEPGDPRVPEGFNARRARQFVFTRE